MSFQSYQPGNKIFVHCPYTEADGPNPKLISPWKGPYVVRSRLSPVIYSVSKGDQPEEISVHLGRTKPYFETLDSSVTDWEALDELFLGQKIPMPDLNRNSSKIKIGNLTVRAVERHDQKCNRQTANH